MNRRTLRLGTRGSALALWQANWTKQELETRWPGLTVNLVPIKTTGDKILDVPLAKASSRKKSMKLCWICASMLPCTA
jgi:hydroxymethylbilane synthase